MGDPNVERWRQRGRICLWKNKVTDAQWNMTADDPACDGLTDLFDRMERGQYSSQKQLSLVKPTITADHGGRRRFKAARQLTIKYPKERVTDGHWLLEQHDRDLLLVVGLSRLHELRDAVADIRAGGGDYAIGDDESPIWVWWWVEQSAPS